MTFFPKLDHLNLGFNRLQYLPSNFPFPKLSQLMVNDNQIANVDTTGIFELNNLKTLDISNNNIARLPNELGLLNLTYLGVQGNCFKVPRQYAFGYLYFGDKSFNNCPNRAIVQKGTETILLFLRERLE